MAKNVDKWKEARIGFDPTGVPISIELLDKKDGRTIKDIKELSKKSSNIDVSKVPKKNDDFKPKPNRCYNRKWQILEIVRKNEPTTPRVISQKVGKKRRNISRIIYRLMNDKWIERFENNIYDDGRIPYVYEIGNEGKRFLEDKNANSFLWPDNPIDPGPNAERLQR